MRPARIGLVGDFNPSVTAHQAIPLALSLAASALDRPIVASQWLPTDKIERDPSVLSGFTAFWCVPASPYASTDGALTAIRYARENKLPFLGTCGGFQHAILEYARNILGWNDAAHAETDAAAARPVLTRLSCSLVEKADRIFLQQGSRIAAIYGCTEITEAYRCNFGLNRQFETAFQGGSLAFTGHDAGGEVRVFELNDHPFFIGTLFQPKRSALRGEPHPLIQAFVSSV